ncbi:MAG TPA: 5'-nucleotidase, partial [Polyangiales bacterium]|nr:5'-nucleotidase [Polyangiales bacterium]
MGDDSADKLVIAIASSALFKLDDADRIFHNEGESSYRKYQREKETIHLQPGIAFPFIRRLLALNLPDDAPIDVVLLSRNDPDTGLRVMNSIEAHKLGITRAAFVKGKDPQRYIGAFNASLFLSANEQDVRAALQLGSPAGLVLESLSDDDGTDDELRIAFDFDGVLADDASETIYRNGGLQVFNDNERQNAGIASDEGPLHGLFHKIARLQQRDKQRARENTNYRTRVRIAIITARGAPAHKRVVTSLREWGIEVDEAFFLAGLRKTAILKVFKPHLFFDDQQVHLKEAAQIVPC